MGGLGFCFFATRIECYQKKSAFPLIYHFLLHIVCYFLVSNTLGVRVEVGSKNMKVWYGEGRIENKLGDKKISFHYINFGYIFKQQQMIKWCKRIDYYHFYWHVVTAVALKVTVVNLLQILLGIFFIHFWKTHGYHLKLSIHLLPPFCLTELPLALPPLYIVNFSWQF